MYGDIATRDAILDAAFFEMYKKGYHGTSISSILRASGVAKGSLYHFFPSKKNLVLAVIQERIIPRIREFFRFKPTENESVYECLQRTFSAMEKHELLLRNGCPLHRIMVEMAPLDSAIERVVHDEFEQLVQRLERLFQKGIERGEFHPFDTATLARFFVTSTWGELSLSPSLTSPDAFCKHYRILLQLLQTFSR